MEQKALHQTLSGNANRKDEKRKKIVIYHDHIIFPHIVNVQRYVFNIIPVEFRKMFCLLILFFIYQHSKAVFRISWESAGN